MLSYKGVIVIDGNRLYKVNWLMITQWWVFLILINGGLCQQRGQMFFNNILSYDNIDLDFGPEENLVVGAYVYCPAHVTHWTLLISLKVKHIFLIEKFEYLVDVYVTH